MNDDMSRQPTDEKLSARVRRTLADLAIIRESLTALSEEQARDAAAVSRQCLDIELAGELKSVVDALRQLLWAYIKALSTTSGRTPYEVLNWYKMEIAVDLLRSLRNRSNDPDRALGRFEELVNSTLMISSQHAKNDPHC
jgi:hypothetical protein